MKNLTLITQEKGSQAFRGHSCPGPPSASNLGSQGSRGFLYPDERGHTWSCLDSIRLRTHGVEAMGLLSWTIFVLQVLK